MCGRTILKWFEVTTAVLHPLKLSMKQLKPFFCFSFSFKGDNNNKQFTCKIETIYCISRLAEKHFDIYFVVLAYANFKISGSNCFVDYCFLN